MSLSATSSIARIAFISIVGLAILLFGAWVAVNQKDDDNIFLIPEDNDDKEVYHADLIEAELIDDEIKSEST